MRTTLLLSDVPPCTEWTAGLFLHPLCRLFPEGCLSCFAVVEPLTNVPAPADLRWMPLASKIGPREKITMSRWARLEPVLGWAYHSWVYPRHLRSLVSSIVAFGRTQKIQALWCLLERPTLIRLAVRVAGQLGVPLFTQVLDPPTWWIRGLRLDRFTARKVLREFELALRASECCATASWNMAEDYIREYGIDAIPVIPSLDRLAAMPAAQQLHAGDEVVICLAGQLYATEEWNALLAALRSAGWMIGGRRVSLRILGRNTPALAVDAPVRIEFLGWHSQAQTLRLLSEADILYCPYWFNPLFQQECRHSFPSKLTSYLASGRPVLFHGPAYASPASFLKKTGAGLCCHSLDLNDIRECLHQLVSDEDLYARLAHQGREAFLKHLTTETMRQSFARFMGIPAAQLREAA